MGPLYKESPGVRYEVVLLSILGTIGGVVNILTGRRRGIKYYTAALVTSGIFAATLSDPALAVLIYFVPILEPYPSLRPGLAFIMGYLSFDALLKMREIVRSFQAKAFMAKVSDTIIRFLQRLL